MSFDDDPKRNDPKSGGEPAGLKTEQEKKEALEQSYRGLLKDFYQFYKLAESNPSAFFTKWNSEIKRAEWRIFHTDIVCHRGLPKELVFAAIEAFKILSGASSELAQSNSYKRPDLTQATKTYLESLTPPLVKVPVRKPPPVEQRPHVREAYSDVERRIFTERIASANSFAAIHEALSLETIFGSYGRRRESLGDLAKLKMQGGIILTIVRELQTNPLVLPEQYLSAITTDFGLQDRARVIAGEFVRLATLVENEDLSFDFLTHLRAVLSLIDDRTSYSGALPNWPEGQVTEKTMDSLRKLLELSAGNVYGRDRFIWQLTIDVLPFHFGIKKKAWIRWSKIDREYLAFEAGNLDFKAIADMASVLRTETMEVLEFYLAQNANDLSLAMVTFEQNLRSLINPTTPSKEILDVIEEQLSQPNGPIEKWNITENKNIFSKAVYDKMLAYKIINAIKAVPNQQRAQLANMVWEKYRGANSFERFKKFFTGGENKNQSENPLRQVFLYLYYSPGIHSS